MIKIKTNLRGLIYLEYLTNTPLLIAYNGKLFTFVEGGSEPVLFYAEGEPKGEFIRYIPLENSFKWVDKIRRKTDVVYIPVIKAEKVEGIE